MFRRVILVGTLAAAAVAAQTPLTVVVFDYASLSSEALSSAARLAQKAFRLAGVDTTWSICGYARDWPDGCTQPLPPTGRYVSMLVMPRMAVRPPTSDAALACQSGGTLGCPGAALLRPGNTVACQITGYAITGPGARVQPRAWAFYDAVEFAARQAQRAPSTVLGFVMLHEIAHVLGLHHHGRGVMQPALNPRTLDESALLFAFSPIEARVMQEASAALSPAAGLRLPAPE